MGKTIAKHCEDELAIALGPRGISSILFNYKTNNWTSKDET
jgi:hypothetical protein